MKSWYDAEEDIVGFELQKGIYWKSIELDDVVIDISKEGKILGIEIPHAKKVFRGNGQRVLQAAARTSK